MENGIDDVEERIEDPESQRESIEKEKAVYFPNMPVYAHWDIY